MKQWATQGNDVVYGRQVSGSTALLQRHEHMLKTSPGDIISDDEWGLSLDELLGQPELDTRSLASLARGQHLADRETSEAEVSVEINGNALEYSASLTDEKNQTILFETVIE